MVKNPALWKRESSHQKELEWYCPVCGTPFPIGWFNYYSIRDNVQGNWDTYTDYVTGRYNPRRGLKREVPDTRCTWMCTECAVPAGLEW